MLSHFICSSKTLTLSFVKFLLTWTKKNNPAIWPGILEALCDKNRLIFYLNFSHIQQQQKRYTHMELHLCRSSSRLDVKFAEVDFILKVSQSPITANSGNQTTIFTKKKLKCSSPSWDPSANCDQFYSLFSRLERYKGVGDNKTKILPESLL